MQNGWRVIWYEHGRKLTKNGFEGDSPRASGAIDYAKSIVARGISVRDVHIISKRKAFPPTAEMKAKQEPGTSWCPYCMKWRSFRLFALKWKGIILPEDYRCPICTISTNDYYVQRYNPILIAHTSIKPVRVGKPDTTLSKGSRRRRK